MVLKCIWQIFIRSIKSSQCTDKYSKKVFSIAIFLSRVLLYQKHQISLLVGCKTARSKTGDWERLWRQFRTPSLAKNRFLRRSYFLINNALLYHFLANSLAHNKKMTEKSVFREAWSPELTSQSFPVSCFWCRGFVPHRKWNLTLLAHQNTGKENRYRKKFFATLISTLGRFNRANKTKSVIYTLRTFAPIVSAHPSCARMHAQIHMPRHASSTRAKY